MPDSDTDTDTLDLPEDWAEATRQILGGPARRVAVLGPVDVGKSSLCRVLLAAAAGTGRVAALLDADLAQKSVGSPACVTLGLPGPEGMECRGLAFVGALDPLRGWRALVDGVARLAQEAAPADLVLCNTGGFLKGAGRRLKAAKLRAIGAELLVAIGKDPALDAVLADHADLPALRLSPSPLARRKSSARRQANRQEGFRRYFAGAGISTMATDSLRIEGLRTGGAVPPHRLLLGLSDGAGRDLALGLLLGTDPAAGTVTVLAPVGPAGIAQLRGGSLALDAAFREVRLPP